MNLFAKYVYALLTAFAAVHSGYYFPKMPANMAVHFGASGSPDGWSSRTEFFLIAGAMLLVNIAVFAVLPWVVQAYRIKKINVPHKGHWLSAGNIEVFYEFFRTRMAWFGIANILFGVSVMQMVYSANLSTGAVLDSRMFTAVLVAYFVFVIIWLFTLFRKLQHVK